MKKNLFRSRSLKIVLVAVILCCSSFFLGGCAKGTSAYKIVQLPNKIVYQIGETPNFDGLKIEQLNTDGTTSNLNFSAEHITVPDTSTYGAKRVVVKKDDFAVSFEIYVANVVINDSDNLKSAFANLSDGDIVHLRAGNYYPTNQDDLRYKDVEVNKSVTIVGDKKTNFFGNFIVGATSQDGIFAKTAELSGVTFSNINFKLSSTQKNNLIYYSGPYGNTDTNGAIRFFDTKNLSVSNCTFEGYAFGLLGENAFGLTVNGCKFKNIVKNGIKTTKSTKNSTIFGNLFVDIAMDTIAFEDSSRSTVGAIYLSFADEFESGVSICKNVFNRIARHASSPVYYDEYSKNKADESKSDLYKMSYVVGSAIVALVSSDADALNAKGIVVAGNKMGEALSILHLGASGKNSINYGNVLFSE